MSQTNNAHADNPTCIVYVSQHRRPVERFNFDINPQQSNIDELLRWLNILCFQTTV